jgi:hypothetical protein
MVDAVVAAELQNPDIASYFFWQPGAPANGHPTADQIEECLTDFVGNAADGPETYPTTLNVDAGPTADGGLYTCRQLNVIHEPLHIDTGTFNLFLTIAGGELGSYADGGICPGDITALAGAFLGTEHLIVENDGGFVDAARTYDGAPVTSGSGSGSSSGSGSGSSSGSGSGSSSGSGTGLGTGSGSGTGTGTGSGGG